MLKKLLHTDITSTLMFRNVYDICMKCHIPNSSGSFVRTFTVGISRLNILGFDTASVAAYNFLNYEDGGSTFL
jgi:hypothetical protein